ncbi:hypothetical protein D3C81_08860 [compost metagenome]
MKVSFYDKEKFKLKTEKYEVVTEEDDNYIIILGYEKDGTPITASYSKSSMLPV